MSTLNGGQHNGYRPKRYTMDWFFNVVFPKLFMIMVVFIICWCLFIGYSVYSVGEAVISDPAVIGRTLSTVVQGFQETQTK